MRSTESKAIGIALVAIVVLSTWSKLSLLWVSELPVGVDGWYYALQLRSLQETGTLWSPSPPLAFILLLPFSLAAGAIVGAKIGAATLVSLVALPMYSVGRRIGGSPHAGLLAAAVASTSAGSCALTTEFIKNGVGVTLAAAFVALALGASERVRMGAVLMLVAVALTHPLAFALCLPFCAPLLRNGTVVTRIAFVVVTLVVVVAYRAHPAWSTSPFGAPTFTLPALALGARSVWAGYEATLGAVVAVVTIACARKCDDVDARITALGAAALALLIALPWLDVRDPSGVGYRLRLVAFFPLAIAAPFCLRSVRRRTVVAVVVVAWLATHARPSAEGLVVTNPALAAAMENLALPPGALVACPVRQVMFMAAYSARVDAALHPRPGAVRLVPRSYLRHFGPDVERALVTAIDSAGPSRNLHARDPHGLVLMSEATWRVVVDALPPAARAQVEAWPTL